MRSKKVDNCGPAILIVEDNKLHVEKLKREFSRRGFRVKVATNYEAALDAGKDLDLAGAVVDVRLPIKSRQGEDQLWDRAGLDAIEEWRASGFEFPVVIVSIINHEGWKREGYKLGARVYFPKESEGFKPYEPYEVAMPLINAIRAEYKDKLEVPPYTLFVHWDGQKTLKVRDESKSLNLIHMNIMEYMLRRPNRAVRYDALKIFLRDEDVSRNAVHQQVSGLRQEVDPEMCYLKTVRGFGYRLEPGNSAPTKSTTVERANRTG